jgi:hypothetical protein
MVRKFLVKNRRRAAIKRKLLYHRALEERIGCFQWNWKGQGIRSTASIRSVGWLSSPLPPFTPRTGCYSATLPSPLVQN